MATLKALIPGLFLTYLISTALAALDMDGGTLAVYRADLADHHLYWSWPMFVGFTGLSRALVWMME